MECCVFLVDVDVCFGVFVCFDWVVEGLGD